jgi:hypothetical protein
MTKHEAIQIILSDKKSYPTALNYAIDYCQAAMEMPAESEAFKTQCLYILNNITYWRHPQAKEVRATLRS